MAQIYKLPLVLKGEPDGDSTVINLVLPELMTEGDMLKEAPDHM